MRDLGHDVRFALRILAKSPMFALVVILSLALGIGVNSTIFSLVSAVLLRPPTAVTDAGRLVWLFQSRADEPQNRMTFSYPDFVDVRGRRDVFSGVLAYRNAPLHLGRAGATEAEIVTGQFVSGDFFGVLGVTPPLGRAISREDDAAPGAHAVVVLGHGLWQRRFGGDPSLVGRTIVLDRRSFTVVGIAPPGFVGAEVAPPAEAWVPLAMYAALLPPVAGGETTRTRNVHDLSVIGRLASGVDAPGARAAMDTLALQLARSYPDTNRGIGIRIDAVRGGLSPGDRDDAVPLAVLLLGVVGLVLLIACVNVGSLLLARGATRRREIAIRRALGAGRGRLVRQLLTESVLLALAGGAVALVLSFWVADALGAAIRTFPLVSMAIDLSPDVRVLAFTLALSLLSGIGFGLAPALHVSRGDPAPTLAAEAATATAGARRSRLRSAFVVTQIALSLLLLVCAGLFLRSASRARDADPGFDAAHAVTLPVHVDALQIGEAGGRELYRRLLARVAALPGVRAASLAQVLPLGRSAMLWTIGVDGEPGPDRPGEHVLTNVVAPRYFAAMGIPLLGGRDFAADDSAGRPPVVIVSEALARRFLGGDAVGRRVWIGRQGQAEIVGVARDGKYRSVGEPTQPFVYIPLAQSYAPRAHLVVGTDRDAPASLEAIREAVASVDAGLPTHGLEPLARTVDSSLFPARMGAMLLTAFGMLALVLAILGVYGVLAYSVGQRTREIGIRIALGAARRDVLRLVVGEGMKLVAIGLAIGLGLSLAATRVVAGFLYGVSPTDAVTFVAVVLLLAGASLAASWLPARRASRVDPMVALRND